MPYLGKEPNKSATSTIGAGVAEDTMLKFDGNAVDYHIGLDDSGDKLSFGKGSTLGTTTSMTFDENGIMDMPLQSACSVHLSANQSIATGTWTKLSLATELYDQNNDFDSSTNYRYTVPVDGRYLCMMNIGFHLNADMECGVGIWKNGSEIHRRNGVSGVTNAHYHLNCSAVADLDASDYIEFMCFHTFGSDDNITGSKEYTFCMIHKLA